MSFDEDDEPGPVKPKTGVKLSNKNSMFAKTVKKPSAEDFQNLSRDSNARTLAYAERAKDLSTKFVKMMNDKTLSKNKEITASLDKEVITALLQLANEINNDDAQEEGVGSIGVISILFKTVVDHRDKINNLEFSIEKLKEEINKLKEEINKLKSSIENNVDK